MTATRPATTTPSAAPGAELPFVGAAAGGDGQVAAVQVGAFRVKVPPADPVALAIVLHLLDGSDLAVADFPFGPGPCRLPASDAERYLLAAAHVAGTSSRLLFAPRGEPEKLIKVLRTSLGVYLPRPDGLCGFVVLDLDAGGPDGHGEGGLEDPLQAARAVASAVEGVGLADGMLTARSRGARGIHVWLLLGKPVPLDDALLGLVALTAAAYRVAAADVEEGAPHPFRCTDGRIAHAGDAGAVELTPRSNWAPQVGWATRLPFAGRYQAKGGSVAIDPWSGEPLTPTRVPAADMGAWQTIVDTSRKQLGQRLRAPRRASRPTSPTTTARQPRLTDRTLRFLRGDVPEGSRNAEAFAAAANMLGNGLPLAEVECEVLRAAELCGLPKSEAITCVRSAAREKGNAR